MPVITMYYKQRIKVAKNRNWSYTKILHPEGNFWTVSYSEESVSPE